MEADRRAARRAVTAAVVGNVLEWYDFAVYAYMAGVIAKTFFPAGDEATSLLSTFAVFGVGFVMRPLGRNRDWSPGRCQRAQDCPDRDRRADGGGHGADRPDPRLREHRPGCPAAGADRAADTGLLGGRGMGQFDRLHRRVGTREPARAVREPAAVQRCRRVAARLQRGRAGQYRACRPRWSTHGRGGFRSCSAACSGRSGCICGGTSTRPQPSGPSAAGAASSAAFRATLLSAWPRAPSASRSCGPSPTISCWRICRLSRSSTPD